MQSRSHKVQLDETVRVDCVDEEAIAKTSTCGNSRVVALFSKSGHVVVWNKVVAIVLVTEATGELEAILFAEIKVTGGDFVGAAEGVRIKREVDDHVAAGHDGHEEAAAHVVVLSGCVGEATHAVRAVFAGNVLVRRLEQWLVVATVSVADLAVQKALVHAVLNIIVFWFEAAAINVGHIPGDAVAPGHAPFHTVLAGSQVLGKWFAGQTGALVAVDCDKIGICRVVKVLPADITLQTLT